MCPGLKLPLWEPRSLSSQQGFGQEAPAAGEAHSAESLHRTRSFFIPLQPVAGLQSRPLQMSELGLSRFTSTCPACWPVQSNLMEILRGAKGGL